MQEPGPTVIPRGEQELLIMSTVSPLEVYLTSFAQFREFSEFSNTVTNKVAISAAKHFRRFSSGDLVVAKVNGMWNRAKILDLLPNNFYEVDLFDFADTAEVGIRDICRATHEVMEAPVLVTKCALESFYGREDEALKKEMMVKVKSLMIEFETIKGEMMGEKDGLTWIRIQSVEEEIMKDL